MVVPAAATRLLEMSELYYQKRHKLVEGRNLHYKQNNRITKHLIWGNAQNIFSPMKYLLSIIYH